MRGPFPPSCFFSSRRRHTRLVSDWSSDVCSSDLFIPFPLRYFVGFNAIGMQYSRAHQNFVGANRIFQRPTSFVQLFAAKVVPFQIKAEIGRASCRERV